MRPFKDGISNYIVGLDTIRAQAGFGFEGILELVIGEVGRDDLRAHVDQAAKESENKNQFYRAHNAFPCNGLAAEAEKLQRAGSKLRKYSVIAPMLASCIWRVER